MDPVPPKNPTPQDLSYQVMPQGGGSAHPPSFVQPISPPRVPESLPSEPESSEPGGSRKWLYIIVGVLIVAALAVAAYFLLGSKKSEPETQTPQSRLPKVWLTQYFNKDVCDDQKTCGDNADPESDGLSNYDEFKAGTSPINPDHDSDGLADGDEVHVYKTDPTLKFTDRRDIVAQNNWTDSFQIKGGYDPLTPGIKFTETRNTQIADDTAKYKLHEPTVSTMGSGTTQKTYSNATFGFEFSYPSSWKNITEIKASTSDYLSDSGNRTFVAVYPIQFPASDMSARVDVYSATLAVVKVNHPFLKGETSSSETINGNSWTKISANYLIEKNGKTYHVSGDAQYLNQIVSTFKFTK